MIIKSIVDERFDDYYMPSMLIAFPKCSWKCERDCGQRVCQNSALAQSPDIEVSVDDVIVRYISNPITTAVVLAGLEPFDSYKDVYVFVYNLRMKYRCNDTVVIYTGYTEEESSVWISELREFKNIVVKFGRYIPGCANHRDSVLGVDLASPNQYAKRV
jgi:hypothetical protein